ncbi:MAG: hypothetical protein K6E29_07730 [Cyanobacteria bacterium RUI128]|nr:hypothetical protein [Cyanobacteria bacterium RUI128]
MKVNNVNLTDSNYNKADNNNRRSNPNFKGLLDVPGAAMNMIEKGGFATSFLIQDTAGMTVPRTKEGLERGLDKDRVHATWNVIKARLTFRKPSEEDKAKCLSIKDLNFKEGLEVGIREGLSGPFMMFSPMLVLLAGKKFVGKSTFTNSSMINRLGNKFTKTFANAEANASRTELKKGFYKDCLKDIVKSTTTAEVNPATEKFVEDAAKSLQKLDRYDDKIAQASGKMKKRYKKAQEREGQRLLNAFNDFHKTNSSDFGMVNKVKFDDAVFSTEKTVNGIRAYANDAIKSLKGDTVGQMREAGANTDKFKNIALIKRGLVNAAAAASTIGSLSIVPAIYKLVNPVPPGALENSNPEAQASGARKVSTPASAASATANKPQTQGIDKSNNNDGKISFTGKWDKVARAFEFNGNQYTPALMTSLAVGGLMVPRCLTAAKRAPEDPVTKKKDYSEIPEALTRDIVSTGAVTFGVPMLSKAMIGLYEQPSGFVLRNQAAKPKGTTKKILDYINPFSSFGYYEIKDLDQIYGNIDSPEKLGNMSKFIDDNGGSVAKVLKTEKKTASVFERYGLNMKELAGNADRKAANKTIMDKMAESKEFAQDLIESIKPKKPGSANAILKRARSLNSFVSAAATFFFVPAFLGIVLPKFVYGMTAKRQKKIAEARAAYEAGLVANNDQQPKQEQSKVDYSKLKTSTSATFQSMRSHS